MLTQKKKLRLTSFFSLLLQLLTVVYGFVLPRLILGFYGSSINGLVSSISQFLGFIALADCGVGAVVQSSLYKPLAKKDNFELSKIIRAAEHFYRKIACLFLIYIVILVFVFPKFVEHDFSFVYTASLIVVIAVSTFAQYYFGLVYRFLLMADQFGFIPIVIQIISLSLNLLICVWLIQNEESIHVLKLVSSIVFLLQPFGVSIIAHKFYAIEKKVPLDKKAIPQKWNGFAQHLSTVVMQSSGIFVLTMISSLESVSVYAVYNLVVQGIRNVISSITNGVQAYLGHLFAQNEKKILADYFEKFELKIHFFVCFLFSATASLITPFSAVYTKGVTDANYIEPFFGVLLTAAWGIYCIRLPYNIVVLAVGHYKQTQNSAFVEAGINLCLSFLCVYRLGLIGVAIGPLAAMIYRTVFLAWYISKYILKRPIGVFFKKCLVDVFVVVFYVLLLNMCNRIAFFKNYTYDSAVLSDWLIKACVYSVLSFFATFSIYYIFFGAKKKNTKSCI
jgi:O-antigen/teichoic acid export membrane protein